MRSVVARGGRRCVESSVFGGEASKTSPSQAIVILPRHCWTSRSEAGAVHLPVVLSTTTRSWPSRGSATAVVTSTSVARAVRVTPPPAVPPRRARWPPASAQPTNGPPSRPMRSPPIEMHSALTGRRRGDARGRSAAQLRARGEHHAQMDRPAGRCAHRPRDAPPTTGRHRGDLARRSTFGRVPVAGFHGRHELRVHGRQYIVVLGAPGIAFDLRGGWLLTRICRSTLNEGLPSTTLSARARSSRRRKTAGEHRRPIRRRARRGRRAPPGGRSLRPGPSSSSGPPASTNVAVAAKASAAANARAVMRRWCRIHSAICGLLGCGSTGRAEGGCPQPDTVAPPAGVPPCPAGGALSGRAMRRAPAAGWRRCGRRRRPGHR